MVAEVKRKQEKKEKKRKKREKRRLEALAAAAEEMENSVQEAEVRAEAPSALWAVPLWWPHCAVTAARLPQQHLLLLFCGAGGCPSVGGCLAARRQCLSLCSVGRALTVRFPLGEQHRAKEKEEEEEGAGAGGCHGAGGERAGGRGPAQEEKESDGRGHPAGEEEEEEEGQGLGGGLGQGEQLERGCAPALRTQGWRGVAAAHRLPSIWQLLRGAAAHRRWTRRALCLPGPGPAASRPCLDSAPRAFFQSPLERLQLCAIRGCQRAGICTV